MNRLFEKSDYEKEFSNRFICNYKGIDIYWYIDLMDELKLTFWYGQEDSKYISFVEKLSDAKKRIDSLLETELSGENILNKLKIIKNNKLTKNEMLDIIDKEYRKIFNNSMFMGNYICAGIDELEYFDETEELNISCVENIGGYEGAGSDMSIVFFIEDKFNNKSGYIKFKGLYNSWGDSNYLLSSTKEVSAFKETITVYR